jgi:hypothetical protein
MIVSLYQNTGQNLGTKIANRSVLQGLESFLIGRPVLQVCDQIVDFSWRVQPLCSAAFSNWRPNTFHVAVPSNFESSECLGFSLFRGDLLVRTWLDLQGRQIFVSQPRDNCVVCSSACVFSIFSVSSVGRLCVFRSTNDRATSVRSLTVCSTSDRTEPMVTSIWPFISFEYLLDCPPSISDGRLPGHLYLISFLLCSSHFFLQFCLVGCHFFFQFCLEGSHLFLQFFLVGSHLFLQFFLVGSHLFLQFCLEGSYFFLQCC